MKKEYNKPTIRVIALTNTTHLLAGSQQYEDQPSDDWLNYNPRIGGNDLNKIV